MQSTLPDFIKPCVRRFRHGAWQEIEETLAEEVAVPIYYDGGSKTLWAWPHDLESLAAGHVLLDCLPPEKKPDNPPKNAPEQKPTAAHQLRRAVVNSVSVAQSHQEKHAQHPGFTVKLYTTTSEAPCHVPTTSPAPVLSPLPGLPERISAQELLAHMTAFIRAPGLWDNTGCFHRAALLDMHSGRTVRVAEDIGRHNCIDRLAGYAALHDPVGLHPSRFVLLISSRITASLYHKARRAGFGCMVSRSAVTSGSYKAALVDGVSLLGFCRPEDARLTVFTDGDGKIY